MLPLPTVRPSPSTPPIINVDGNTVEERFRSPDGYIRVICEEGSFADFLRRLPLKADGTKVKYYDGRGKNQNVHLAVVDYPLGDRDLQQCADAVMRLRAEYLYAKGQLERIHFNFVSGFRADFSKWAQGYGIKVVSDIATWVQNSGNDGSYESFQRYLDIVYAYANTYSLEQELIPRDVGQMEIGDVFIVGGFPGHCVIVVDMAIQENTGDRVFILAQSYMPAQDIHILKGDSDDTPWNSAGAGERLNTPQWTFDWTQMRTWEE